MTRLVLAAILLVPPSSGAVAVVRLGLVAPPAEEDATSLAHGALVAVEESREAQGGNVVFEVRGAGGQWGAAGNDAGALAGESEVDGIVAPSDGASSHLVLQVSGRMQVPVASVCPDASVTEAGVPWVVRVVPRNDQQAETLFAKGSGAFPAHWWAFVSPGRPGRAVRRDLEKAARSSGIRLDRITEMGSDAASLAAQASAAEPDGVLVWLPARDAAAIVVELRSAGYRGCLAGPCSIDSPAFAAAAGGSAEGVLVAEFSSDPGFSARRQRFEDRFLHEFGTRPDFAAAAAHDAAQVLIESLRRAGNTAAYRQFPLQTRIRRGHGRDSL